MNLQPLVRLEALVAGHADEMFPVLDDPAIYRHIEDETPVSVHALRRRYTVLETRRSPDGTQQWLNWVVRDGSGSLVGYVQATIVEPGTAWVAYALGSRHWNRGLAQAAMKQMIGLLVDAHAVRRLLAAVDQRNGRSLRLLERLGFTPLPLAQQALRRVSPGDVLLGRSVGPADLP